MSPTCRAYLVDAFIMNVCFLAMVLLDQLGYLPGRINSDEVLEVKVLQWNVGFAFGYYCACYNFRKKNDEPPAHPGYRGCD